MKGMFSILLLQVAMLVVHGTGNTCFYHNLLSLVKNVPQTSFILKVYVDNVNTEYAIIAIDHAHINVWAVHAGNHTLVYRLHIL